MDNQEPTNPEEPAFTKEELKRAMKAFRKRLKLTRLDDESRLGGGSMTGGNKSGIVGIRPPNQYPPEIWEELVRKGRLKKLEHGQYEIVPMPQC